MTIRELLAAWRHGNVYAVANDLIGGWAVGTKDAPLSEYDTPLPPDQRSDHVFAEFLDEPTARLTAYLVNNADRLLRIEEAANEMFRADDESGDVNSLDGEMTDVLRSALAEPEVTP